MTSVHSSGTSPCIASYQTLSPWCGSGSARLIGVWARDYTNDPKKMATIVASDCCSERIKRQRENFGPNIQKFYGLRTRYDSNTCKVLDQAIKIQRYLYTADNDEEQVIHTITYYYEGKDPEERGPWTISFESGGLVHSAGDWMRGYYVSNGDSIWTCKELFPKGKSFANETFFCHGHFRCSVVFAYQPDEKSWRFTYFQEDSNGWDLIEKWAASDISMTSLTKVPNNWPSPGLQLKGREKIVTGNRIPV